MPGVDAGPAGRRGQRPCASPRAGRWAPAVALVLGLGCGVDTTCVVRPCVGPRTLETYAGPPSLDALQFGCCLPEEDPSCGIVGAWWISAVAEGTMTRATLELRAGGLSTGAWSELHPLPLVDRDPQGFWEERGAELASVDTTGCRPLSSCADRFVAGRTTLFSCQPEVPGFGLRAALRLYADGETEPFACHTWGSTGTAPDGCVETTPTF